MEYRFESSARNVVRVTDGTEIRFIPTSSNNAEYRLLCEGKPADESAGLQAIAPVTILNPISEQG